MRFWLRYMRRLQRLWQLVSVPALREFNLSLANEIDEFLGDKDSVIANAIGDGIDKIRSGIGVVVDVVKDAATRATNTIVDAWNWLFK